MPTYTVEILDDDDDEFADVIWTVVVTVPEDGPLKPNEEWACRSALETFRSFLRARIYEGDASKVFPDQRYELVKIDEHKWEWRYA